MWMKVFLSALTILFIYTTAPVWGQQGFKATPIFKGASTVAGQKI